MVSLYNKRQMINIKVIYFLILFSFSLTSFAQKEDDKIILGEFYAEQELKSALSDKSQHNLIDNKTSIIKDSLTIINIVESILFSIYGEDNIINQRPYEIYKIDSYWILTGTLSNGKVGGTFLIIIDSRDCKIIRITHGK